MSESVDSLVEEAEKGGSGPNLPEGGIPRQWVPAWIRQPIKWLFLPFILIDFYMMRLATKIMRPPFKRVGACKKRGSCCHVVLLRASNSIWGKLFFFWHTQFLGFYKRLERPQEYEGKPVYVMGCRYLQKDGSCAQYRLRPLVCRMWPRIEQFGYPRVLKGCGYRSSPPYPQEVPNRLEEEHPLRVLQ